MSDILEVVRDYLPNATSETASHIAWNHTGFPEFFHGDPATALRSQVAGFVHLGPTDEHDDDGCWPEIVTPYAPVSLTKRPPARKDVAA